MRLDTPAPTLPTVDAAEDARSSLVEQSLATADLAAALAELTEQEDLALQAEQVAAGATEQARLLGGKRVPPDWAEDTTGGSDPLATTGEPTTPQTLVDGLSRAATDARAAIGAAPTAQVADLYTAIAVWRAWAAQVLARTTDAEVAAPEAPQVVAATWQLASVEGIQELLRGLDAAGFAYEVLAARSSEGSADYLTRARALRALAGDLATASGLAGTAQDPREALYDVSGLAESSPAAAAAIEADLVALWVQAPLPSALRGTAVDGAVESLLEIQRLTPRSRIDLTALPGYPAEAASDS